MQENLSALSDDALLQNIESVLGSQRQLLARLLSYLGEVEARQLHLRAAYPSLFAFCTDRLRMSEDEACRRILAARLARRFPVVLELIATGELHLSVALALGKYLTVDNHQELLSAASGMTTRQVQMLIAERFPKPDAPSAICPLGEQGSLPVPAPKAATLSAGEATHPASRSATARIEPLSAARFKVQFTAGEALRDKLELALDRLSHVNPSRDLAFIIERGVDLLLEESEKTVLAKTDHPREVAPPADPRTVTRAARREVFERDGERCTFVDERTGRRCEMRALLQVDHKDPRALDGSGQPENLRVLCAPHNRFVAEQKLGRERIEQAKAKRLRGERTESPATPRGDSELSLERAKLHDKLLGMLVNLGFKAKDAKRVLEMLFAQKWTTWPLPPIEQLIREALWALCPA